MHGKSDPIWCLHEIFGVEEFYPAQEADIREFFRHKYDPSLPQYKRFIDIEGMRSGKTAKASMISTYEFWDLCTMSNPAKYWKLLRSQEIFCSVVAPSEEQALDGVFGNCQRFFEDSEWCSTWLDLRIKADKIIHELNNCTLRVLGSWSSTGVGRTNKNITFDELDTFEDNAGKRGAEEVFSRLTKSTDTFHDDGHIVAITSPKHEFSIGMRLYKDLEGDPRTLRRFRETWVANPYQTKEALMEEHKFNMAAFWRDYACMPQLMSSVVFPEGVRLSAMKNVLKDPSALEGNKHLHVIAIDPAARNDAFGMACGYKHNGRTVIDGVIRFTKTKDEVFIRPSDIRSFLDQVLPKLNAYVIVTDTWMYADILEYVHRKYQMHIVQHTVKKPDYDLWRGFQDSGVVDVVADTDLKREAERLLITGPGGTKADHPYGGSKDTADCVANVIWYLNTPQEIDPLKPKMVIVHGF